MARKNRSSGFIERVSVKQRIRVIGIVRRGDDVLLMKKQMGREDGVSYFELPTGKINAGEQPEEAVSRMLYDYVGVQALSIRIRDAVTFLGLERSSQLNNLFIVFDIDISLQSKITPGNRYSGYKFVRYDNLEKEQIDEASRAILGIEQRPSETRKDFKDAINGITVYVDGGSRGNPGPSGIGYYIVDKMGNCMKKGGEFIGFATSRVAEYCAFREGCKQALQLGIKTVRFVSDSLMVVNQLNGVYKVKNGDLVDLYNEVKDLLQRFDNYAIVHVKREYNEDADEEANSAIDRHFSQ